MDRPRPPSHLLPDGRGVVDCHVHAAAGLNEAPPPRGGGGEKMGSVLGAQAAYASLGFLLGSAAEGRLTERYARLAYAASSALAACNVAFRMSKSLDFASGGSLPRPLPAGRKMADDEDDVPAVGSVTRFLEAPLSSVHLMYSYDPHMCTLAALLLLQSIPMYM